jgi:hypothetical protein
LPRSALKSSIPGTNNKPANSEKVPIILTIENSYKILKV